jgi:hypothetical protein
LLADSAVRKSETSRALNRPSEFCVSLNRLLKFSG